MNKTDLMVANSEFTISDRGTPMKNKIYTFKALPNRVKIYDEMGIDLITLANNHVFDFGEEAFMDMMDILDEKKLPHIGAGRNKEEAIKPYYFIINGYKIGFVNATRAEKYILTPEAEENSPGVFRCYDPTQFIEKIKETKEKSDYVIALIHWGKEDTHELEQVQIETGKLYIDAGADALIGSHAHVLQGIEFYNEKPIIYNLGDFIFNRETKETGIFNINISNDGNLTYSFIPCMQDNYKTTMLEGTEKQNTINNMNKWSINAKLDNKGNIMME
jgi:poly-gamma-glutamate synthesis protein (capsule biosynthesis protein)